MKVIPDGSRNRVELIEEDNSFKEAMKMVALAISAAIIVADARKHVASMQMQYDAKEGVVLRGGQRVSHGLPVWSREEVNEVLNKPDYKWLTNP